MMELRKAEAEVNELKVEYERLFRVAIITGEYDDATAGIDTAKPSAALLPPLSDLLARVRQDRSPPPPDAAAATTTSTTAATGGDGRDGNNDEATISLTAKEALSSLEALKAGLDKLEVKCSKFRKRLGEKDPVTDAPRYGTKTAARVVDLLDAHDALVMGVSDAFGNDGGDGDDSNNNSYNNAVQSLRDTVANEEERAKKAEEKARALAMDEASRAALEAKKLEEEQKQKEIQEERQRIMHEADLHRQAIEARQRREEEEAMAEREAREADRAFVASIAKGPDGVRMQLKAMREGCAAEPGSFDVAIGALHTLFSQIASHPEEVKFRRIRRDHPKFNEDIGRHPGGKEVFIAAGFTLETLDGINSFFSKEPDLESDMDGWSAWFDGLKKTLDIIEEETMK